MSILLLWCMHVMISWTGFSPVPHDLHLSRCEINYDDSTDAIQISISIFIDDLELALSERGYQNLRLLTNGEHLEAEEYIGDYFNDKLRVVIDNQLESPIYLGKELGDDIFAAWFYLEIPNIDPQENIEVTYDLLMEIFDDQRNIVKIFYDQARNDYFLLDQTNFVAQLKL